jgi:iron complex outermembrane receptor protein
VYPDLNQRARETRGIIPIGTRYRLRDDAFDPSASILYRISDALNVYASAARGTKSGGVQFTNYTQADGQVNSGIFAPETAMTYEVGIKYGFPSGHLHAAAFRTRVENFQNALFNGVSFTLTQEQNKSKGLEYEAAIRPLEHLELAVAATYVEAHYVAGNVPAANVGRSVLRSPQFTYHLRADYSRPLGAGYSLGIQPVVRFTDRYRFSFNPAVPPRASTWIYDLRLSVDNARGGWSLAVLGRNLSDERSVAYAFPAVAGGSAVTLERPRTLALQLTLWR